ncbi:Centromere/Kinetochore protein Zw10 [Carpediemonas membranifera]|uniref:Centromere/Kinetochore protein Zw10 n=1 Tax=Carpediemonas membranifera TaxID=201153 RepID=A0A8J6AUC3_9EUKA|nr:Centromere/Kinetochore protein Zw10 [Carpediemonas membranifera]|eukprot:KAG9392690.1 Centromere/Kinetochore protein Zw10 [Carpediemonas membranifera]
MVSLLKTSQGHFDALLASASDEIELRIAAVMNSGLVNDYDAFSVAKERLLELEPVVSYLTSTEKAMYKMLVHEYRTTVEYMADVTLKHEGMVLDEIAAIRAKLDNTSNIDDHVALMGRLASLSLYDYSEKQPSGRPDPTDVAPPKPGPLGAVIDAISKYPIACQSNVAAVRCDDLGLTRLTAQAVVPTLAMFDPITADTAQAACHVLAASLGMPVTRAPVSTLLLLYSGLDVIRAKFPEVRVDEILKRLRSVILTSVLTDSGLSDHIDLFEARLDVAARDNERDLSEQLVSESLSPICETITAKAAGMRMFLPTDGFKSVFGRLINDFVFNRVVGAIFALKDISIATSEVLHTWITTEMPRFLHTNGFSPTSPDDAQYVKQYHRLMAISCLLAMRMAEIGRYVEDCRTSCPLTANELERVVRMVFTDNENRAGLIAKIRETVG